MYSKLNQEFDNTGLPWHKMKPRHWKVKKVKNIAVVKSSKRVFEEQYRSTGIPFYRSKEIVELANNKEISIDLFIESELYKEFDKKFGIPKKGDLLITSIGTIGEVWISDGREFYYKDGNITQLISGEELEPEFIKYCFQSNFFKEQYTMMSAGSTLMALTIEKIKELYVLLPSKDEQKLIINYLNDKIKTVDELISNKQVLIRLLEEKRQSMITEAVTKGLNSNVKMKDSGVEWIGEIPEHWEVTKLKFVADTMMGQSPASEDCNSEGIGKPFLQGNAEFTEYNPIPKNYCINPNKISQKNDILLSVRAPVGEINISNVEYGIGRGLCAITPKTSNLYFRYLLIALKESLLSLSTGSTFEAVSLDDVKNLTVILPSNFKEELEIVSYLNEVCDGLDKLKAKLQTQISKLKEYRQSLIYEAVTGKIDVRDFEVKA
ncbi:hypothetical protein CBR59_25590 [Bacillus thuringiensis]|uniref:restriction endonuclease subunit S n=1 Tax=Bacillus thuringiensis TaxID=1428 RepID=UPI000C9DB3C7|nr:restriction endonuclease subunit S [Bacillus thuringiensis]PNK24270.1 hypothetical protein CBP87_26805 [Bacillus thuringiensis]PNK50923.1 hypothetical protein CBR59_25590 [Bacillus thuringiensis]